ncbi:hypothetical protein, partial [Porphyromonas loveana]|uniref:hypothetical protein n=1 Tax=Porphyromonas loveana TaxID=1884669 RepID=UPI00359FD719
QRLSRLSSEISKSSERIHYLYSISLKGYQDFRQKSQRARSVSTIYTASVSKAIHNNSALQEYHWQG